MTQLQETPSLLSADAPQWNRDLLIEFQTALERDPAADLLSLFTERYRFEHQLAQSTKLSAVGKINIKVMGELDFLFRSDPEIDLLSAFPSTYTRRISLASGPAISRRVDATTSEPEFRTKLDDVNTATVVFPLSETVQSLLFSRVGHVDANAEEYPLSNAVKHLIWNSSKLWECHVRGVVVKCSDEIVAKVITKTAKYAEYTSLDYLMEEAPDIPAPRPHGLIALGPFQVLFMSYIPGVTLTKAWPNLLPNQKSSIQQQLDELFSRLRTLQMANGHTLGGVCGEGVKELRVDECAFYKGITTTAQYSDLQFSAENHGSKTYAEFLRSFVYHDGSCSLSTPVFTHGDVRTDNIMVDWTLNADKVNVTGIIDWEDSGFYPDYYECTALTRTLGSIEENDWYLYLPDSISPSRYPQRWLVDRLWGIHLRTT
nr:hypothetical protein CFP56_09475 [Quercus suber]